MHPAFQRRRGSVTRSRPPRHRHEPAIAGGCGLRSLLFEVSDMRLLRVLTAAIGLAALLPSLSAAQGGRQFKDAWFWGVKGGGVLYSSASTENSAGPAGRRRVADHAHAWRAVCELRPGVPDDDGQLPRPRSGQHVPAERGAEEPAALLDRGDGVPDAVAEVSPVRRLRHGAEPDRLGAPRRARS